MVVGASLGLPQWRLRVTLAFVLLLPYQPSSRIAFLCFLSFLLPWAYSSAICMHIDTAKPLGTSSCILGPLCGWTSWRGGSLQIEDFSFSMFVVSVSSWHPGNVFHVFRFLLGWPIFPGYVNFREYPFWCMNYSHRLCIYWFSHSGKRNLSNHHFSLSKDPEVVDTFGFLLARYSFDLLWFV